MPKFRAGKKLRILDFDIENRPLSYLGQDFTTGEITAIAASWVGERKVHVWALGEEYPCVFGACMTSLFDVLEGFLALYNQADVVTGHYIRRHDLPYISGAMMELGLGRLSPKLVSDTKVDLKIAKGISQSQESLGEMLGLKAPKVQMNQPKWREANRLTPEGIALTKKRVVGDVKQHKQLRERLVKEGLLNPPTIWKP